MITDLVIPAVNERPNIDALFDALAPLQTRIIRHVVVADNGSTDGTPEAAAARGAAVAREPRRGYGAACLRAMAWIARQSPPPDVVTFLDADLADDPASLPALLAPISRGEAELVIGSRVREAAPGALTTMQRAGNCIACAMMAALTGRRYHDLGPFRAVRWETLCRLKMADRTWGWTVEMQMKAALANLPAAEIDVPYRPRRAGRSKISGRMGGAVSAGTRIMFTIIVLWWRRREIAGG